MSFILAMILWRPFVTHKAHAHIIALRWAQLFVPITRIYGRMIKIRFIWCHCLNFDPGKKSLKKIISDQNFEASWSKILAQVIWWFIKIRIVVIIFVSYDDRYQIVMVAIFLCNCPLNSDWLPEFFALWLKILVITKIAGASKFWPAHFKIPTWGYFFTTFDLKKNPSSVIFLINIVNATINFQI